VGNWIVAFYGYISFESTFVAFYSPMPKFWTSGRANDTWLFFCSFAENRRNEVSDKIENK
jgi:hypothetical protein